MNMDSTKQDNAEDPIDSDNTRLHRIHSAIASTWLKFCNECRSYWKLWLGFVAIAAVLSTLFAAVAVLVNVWLPKFLQPMAYAAKDTVLQTLEEKGWTSWEGQAAVYGLDDWIVGEYQTCTSELPPLFDFNRDKNRLYCAGVDSNSVQHLKMHSMPIKYHHLRSVAKVFEGTVAPDEVIGGPVFDQGWHSIANVGKINWWCQRRADFIECSPTKNDIPLTQPNAKPDAQPGIQEPVNPI